MFDMFTNLMLDTITDLIVALLLVALIGGLLRVKICSVALMEVADVLISGVRCFRWQHRQRAEKIARAGRNELMAKDAMNTGE